MKHVIEVTAVLLSFVTETVEIVVKDYTLLSRAESNDVHRYGSPRMHAYCRGLNRGTTSSEICSLRALLNPNNSRLIGRAITEEEYATLINDGIIEWRTESYV